MSAPHFPGFGEIGRLGDPPKPPKPEKKPEPSEAEVLKQRLEEAEARERAANDALRKSVERSAVPQPPRKVAPVPPKRPGKMPDPATKPDEFEAWQEEVRAYERWETRQEIESVRSKESSAAASNRVIDNFLHRNPKYAPLRSQVLQCYHEAAVDLNLSEIPEDTKELDELAAKKINALVNTAAKAAGLDRDDDDDTGRTEGLSAGSTGGSAGAGPPKEDDGVQIKSLYDIMRERQADSGLF